MFNTAVDFSDKLIFNKAIKMKFYWNNKMFNKELKTKKKQRKTFEIVMIATYVV